MWKFSSEFDLKIYVLTSIKHYYLFIILSEVCKALIKMIYDTKIKIIVSILDGELFFFNLFNFLKSSIFGAEVIAQR